MSANDENQDPQPDQEVSVTDPRIQIRTKMSRIHNTIFLSLPGTSQYILSFSVSSFSPLYPFLVRHSLLVFFRTALLVISLSFSYLSRPAPPIGSTHCKKWLSFFPSPAGMSLTILSLVGNNLIITRPGRVWLVTSPLGTGKMITFFTVQVYLCCFHCSSVCLVLNANSCLSNHKFKFRKK